MHRKLTKYRLELELVREPNPSEFDMDLKHIQQLTDAQARYYGKLLFLYQLKLRDSFAEDKLWIDAYSIAKMTCSDKYKIASRRSIIQKYLDGKIRGSPVIREILESSSARKTGRGNKKGYRPKGITEFLARRCVQYCKTYAFIRDVWAAQFDYNLEQYYMIPRLIKEHRNNILAFQNLIANLNRLKKKQIKPQLQFHTQFMKALPEFRKNLPKIILEERKQINELKKWRPYLEDLLLYMFKIVRECTEKLGMLGYLNAEELFHQMRKSEKPMEEVIKPFLRFKEIILKHIKLLSEHLDGLIYEHNLSNIKMLNWLPPSIDEIYRIKEQLDAQLKNGEISPETYRIRLKRLIDTSIVSKKEHHRRLKELEAEIQRWKNLI